MFSFLSLESLNLFPFLSPNHLHFTSGKYLYPICSIKKTSLHPKICTHDCFHHNFHSKISQLSLGCYLIIYNCSPIHLGGTITFLLKSIQLYRMLLYLYQQIELKCVKLWRVFKVQILRKKYRKDCQTFYQSIHFYFIRIGQEWWESVEFFVLDQISFRY